MATDNDVRRVFERMVTTASPVFVGKVVAVDREARTCDVRDESAGVDIYDVLLQPVTGADAGVVIYPAVGADILMLYDADTAAYIAVMTSEVDALQITVGSASIEVKGGCITANGGKNGGVINIDALQRAHSAVVADITSLAANLAIVATAAKATINFVQTSGDLPEDIEDTKFRH